MRTITPQRLRSAAAIRPVGPAPTIRTSVVVSSGAIEDALHEAKEDCRSPAGWSFPDARGAGRSEGPAILPPGRGMAVAACLLRGGLRGPEVERPDDRLDLLAVRGRR